MDSINVLGREYTLEHVERNLREFRELLILLDRKEITPSRVIGVGYQNPRKSAYEYLNRRIGMYTVLEDMMKGSK
jgi:hypothetical protein